MAKPVEYILEIYEPGSLDGCWMVFNTSNPFLNISAGDIVNPGLWPNSQAPNKLLRVTNVEHFIWESQVRVAHKLCVFTEEVPDGRELVEQRHPSLVRSEM